MAAGCQGEAEQVEEAVAENEGASTGDAEDDLEFEEPAEVAGEAAEGAPQAEARERVEQSVAASRLTLEGERLELDTRKAEIDAAAAELEARLSGIAELERRLDERIGAGETARQRKAQRIGVLAKLILSMPPQSAATMVGKMSDEDAQALVLQMSRENERKASKLLSAMAGERAAQIGQLYLDRDPKALDVEPAKAEAKSQASAEAEAEVEADPELEGDAP
jgi:flagellar motility protein MotE (MotC chaperone)